MSARSLIRKALILGKYRRFDPYRPENDKMRSIFIHVPKVAGTSIVYSIYGCGMGHVTANHYRWYDANRFAEFFTFGFVRNPWDRFASAYSYLSERSGSKWDIEWANRNMSEAPDFDRFVKKLIDDRTYRKQVMQWQHFRPQSDYLCDRSGSVIVDFVGRFENLKNDFDEVCRKLEIEVELPHRRPTKTRRPYMEQYDKCSIDLVSELYHTDIKQFGYNFVEE